MPTYRELEASLFGSKPIELYHFYRGTEDWFYTSSKFTVSFDSEVWTPLEITRGQIEYGGQDKPGALSVTVPTDSAIGLVFQAGTAPTPISLSVTRLQSDAPLDPAIVFIGEVGGADVQIESITLQCWPFTARLDQTVPQGLYQRDQCQWNTYDPLTCKVDKPTFTFTGTIADISGLNILVNGAGAFNPGTGIRVDMFVSGIVQKGEYQAMIDKQDGDTLVLIEPIPGLLIGNTVDVIAGDDRLLSTCRDKFDNVARRLAFPKLPVVNPFYGRGLA